MCVEESMQFRSSPAASIQGHGLEDGVSLTHGAAGSRQHIWSFVAALYEEETRFPHLCCACTIPKYRGLFKFHLLLEMPTSVTL